MNPNYIYSLYVKFLSLDKFICYLNLNQLTVIEQSTLIAVEVFVVVSLWMKQPTNLLYIYVWLVPSDARFLFSYLFP